MIIMQSIYLDHAATTPIDPRVLEAMMETSGTVWGNPSSIHSFGRQARRKIEEARASVAELIGARLEEEIFFTSGGTEADNLAVIGASSYWLAGHASGRIITSPVEHHAVLHACQYVERQMPIRVEYLPVDGEGRVLKQLPDCDRNSVFFMSVMLANNEVGTIQPIRELAELAHEHGWIMHTDAVQAVGQIQVDVMELGVDLLSLSGHKIYGPKGVGALYVRKGTRLHSMLQGGSQERRLRPGTENLTGIIGLGVAARLAQRELEQRSRHMTRLREHFWQKLQEMVPDVTLNGAVSDRLPNNVNVSFKDLPGEQLLLQLDLSGVAASSGSACTAGSIDPSHVLIAMGKSKEEAQSAIRFTLGKDTTEEEIDLAVQIIQQSVDRIHSRLMK